MLRNVLLDKSQRKRLGQSALVSLQDARQAETANGFTPAAICAARRANSDVLLRRAMKAYTLAPYDVSACVVKVDETIMAGLKTKAEKECNQSH